MWIIKNNDHFVVLVLLQILRVLQLNSKEFIVQFQYSTILLFDIKAQIFKKNEK